MALAKKLFALLSLVLTLITTEALECYTCDSAQDKECATRPGQQIDVEECLNTNDQCVTVITAGHTRRGCLLNLFPNGYCPEPCEKCSSSLCNRNIFPPDRLRCYQCLGSDCIDVSKKSELVLPCPVYNENDRCYTNVIRESNVQRGCEKTDLPKECPNVCLKCNYDACNNELGVHEESCFECMHTTMGPNPECLRALLPDAVSGHCRVSGVKKCTNRMMHGHKGKCYSYINPQTNVVQRGCSTTKPFFPSGILTECYGKDCNSGCYSIACNDCDATTSSHTSLLDRYRCRFGKALTAHSCSEDTFACYSCEAGSQLRRGCLNSSFVEQPNEVCHVCRDADGCNRYSVRTCYHCSSLDDPNCTSWQDSSHIERRNCSMPGELCVSTLVNRYSLTFTVRGCASQVPECTESDPYCVRCNGSLCNTEPIPWQQSIQTLALDVRNGQNAILKYNSLFAMVVIVTVLLLGEHKISLFNIKL